MRTSSTLTTTVSGSPHQFGHIAGDLGHPPLGDGQVGAALVLGPWPVERQHGVMQMEMVG